MSILTQTAYGLIANIRRKQLSVKELVKSTITRIRDINPQVNAIVSLRDEKDILADAVKADFVPMENRGVLHGIPIAIKDLANAEGLVTTEGSLIYADRIAEKDDIFVKRIRDAGAIIIGKTNTPEFGLGSHTFNSVFGITRNPFDLSRSSGGSSGGAAVSLATGMLSIADGSVMMGSLRNPAAWNNVYGMRPTWGLVQSENSGNSFLHSLSTSGPMARNPTDVALLLSVMSATGPKIPVTFNNNKRRFTLQAADVVGKRVGWLRDFTEGLAFDSNLLELSEFAVKKFEDIGATVDLAQSEYSIDLLWESWTRLRSQILSTSYAHLLLDADLSKLLKPEVAWEIERGQSLSEEDILEANNIRSDWYSTTDELFKNFDFLALPSTQVWPFKAHERHPTEIRGVQMDTYHRWMEIVIPASLIGLPVLNVPAGFGPGGLPFGLQLIGPKNSDYQLISIGQAWHEMKNWPDAHTPKY